MPEYRLHHMTWPQVRDALEYARVAIVPIGATEQHGPALKAGIDYRIAEALAEQTVAAADGLALMAPPIPVGFSPHHMDFPGTLTARITTLCAILEDYLASLNRHGLRRFVLMNGHGGNLAFLPGWMAEYRERTGDTVAVVHWSMMGRDVVVDAANSEVYGHACEVETGLAKHLVPDVVLEEELGGPAPLLASESALYRGHAIPERNVGAFTPRSLAEFSSNGALGDPATYDSDKGRELFEKVRDRSVELIRHMAEAPTADRTARKKAEQISAAWGTRT
ncbi:creatininase family protein [Streptomonospora litoralis]|uniref:Creatinine amidohydrolase n=1 Tax=Streptomonospora litoralis TaxID=2498135 RepID=A0A4P6PXS3_9ACTN|nr:creatininase family protein [Streptomonospora litoralis]QBI53008.1 Creatinine amidohydrolase [Streptomonospora litoralis]